MSNPFFRDKNIIDVVKYKWLWLGISAILVIPGLIAMIYSTVVFHSPMKLGIDFTGGTMLQYGFKKELSGSDIGAIRENLAKIGIENPVIQLEQSDDMMNIKVDATKASVIEKIPQPKKANINSIVSIRTGFLDSDKSDNKIVEINQVLKDKFGDAELLQTNSIGPTLGKELFKNAVFALLLAFIAIVGYLAFRFKADYAMFALVALFHDALFVCGIFAILGLFFNVEVDGLFITAILTVIGFSVHDTIVVFDRIRENSRFLAKKMSFNDIVNASVNQTLARSINTSLTTLITLFALYFLGGSTTKNFVLAMILGIAIGTYSSIFNASTLLAMWRDRNTTGKKKPAIA
ncbi:MAG: SecD/SecF/SecDF export membrane protein:SecF protein [uncultured bacterium]|nr:MAG: SecD/SecF/SecDF export membrane protein:SecF protein [uncultured bacterium]